MEPSAALWEQVTRPSLEAISKMVDDKKTGGVFVGQRAGTFIVDAASNEEIGKTLAKLPILGSNKMDCSPT